MKTLVTLGLGALAMYLFDPQQGRERRARLRDQVTHANRVARERVQAQLERARSHGRSGSRPNEWPHERPVDAPEGAQHLGR